MRLQIYLLWLAFSKLYVYRDRLRGLGVDGGPKQTKKCAFKKVNVFVWTQPEVYLFNFAARGLFQKGNCSQDILEVHVHFSLAKYHNLFTY